MSNLIEWPENTACMLGLKCTEECDSKSLCSPCAMQYRHYTKDSLLTSWLPPLAHAESDQILHNQTLSMRKWESHKAVKRAPPAAQWRSVQKPDGVSVVVPLNVFNSSTVDAELFCKAPPQNVGVISGATRWFWPFLGYSARKCLEVLHLFWSLQVKMTTANAQTLYSLKYLCFELVSFYTHSVTPVLLMHRYISRAKYKHF